MSIRRSDFADATSDKFRSLPAIAFATAGWRRFFFKTQRLSVSVTQRLAEE